MTGNTHTPDGQKRSLEDGVIELQGSSDLVYSPFRSGSFLELWVPTISPEPATYMCTMKIHMFEFGLIYATSDVIKKRERCSKTNRIKTTVDKMK